MPPLHHPILSIETPEAFAELVALRRVASFLELHSFSHERLAAHVLSEAGASSALSPCDVVWGASEGPAAGGGSGGGHRVTGDDDNDDEGSWASSDAYTSDDDSASASNGDEQEDQHSPAALGLPSEGSDDGDGFDAEAIEMGESSKSLLQLPVLSASHPVQQSSALHKRKRSEDHRISSNGALPGAYAAAVGAGGASPRSPHAHGAAAAGEQATATPVPASRKRTRTSYATVAPGPEPAVKAKSLSRPGGSRRSSAASRGAGTPQ
jgi:hypothetical protein